LMHAVKRTMATDRIRSVALASMSKHADMFNDTYAAKNGDTLAVPVCRRSCSNDLSDQTEKPPQAAHTAKRELRLQTFLRIAYPLGPNGSAGATAVAHRCHRATVSYGLKGVAWAFLRQQEQRVQVQLRQLHSGSPALLLIDKVKWDETSQACTTVFKSRPTGESMRQTLKDKRVDHIAQKKANRRRKRKIAAVTKLSPNITCAKDAVAVCKSKFHPHRRRRLRGGAETVMLQRRWIRWLKVEHGKFTMKLAPIVVPAFFGRTSRRSVSCLHLKRAKSRP